MYFSQLKWKKFEKKERIKIKSIEKYPFNSSHQRIKRNLKIGYKSKK